MINNSISFGNSDKSNGSIFGAIKDSALNVGFTAVAGGALGGIGGKIASLTPYKPSTSAIEAQYGDMFLKAGIKEELPEYISNMGDEVASAVKKGAELVKEDIAIGVKVSNADKLYSIIKTLPEDDLSKDNIQKALKEFFGDKSDFAFKDAKKDEIIEAIKNKFKELMEKSKDINNEFSTLKGQFIESASKDYRVQTMAEKAAKDLRRNAMVGAGIAVGVFGALVLNILKTYGIIGAKHKQAPVNNATGAVNNAMQPLKTTQG